MDKVANKDNQKFCRRTSSTRDRTKFLAREDKDQDIRPAEERPAAERVADTEARPREPREPIMLLNDLLDLVRGVVMGSDVQFVQEWLKQMVGEAPAAYVVGLSKETWMWIKINTTVDGRQLPNEAYLSYGGFKASKSDGDEEECFLLAGLMSIVHELLQAGERGLALQLLENISAESLLAYITGFDHSVFTNLKRRIWQEQPARFQPQCFLSPSLRVSRRELDDEESAWCPMGMDPMPLRRIPRGVFRSPP
eukprot:TRINITY_DN10128_c0_g1_i1.p1 TRINITY_DN10128_c0_g1~~TRINITY_DN10128_c0_g1_i1.p1  ORF type:complete len:252 (-),score=32.11 TRINITY_DN10128_c0_g1_i1:420-1175(-)